jgi:transcriptional regulator with XRE-family HTH domain/tetratricopeptide (TPR) repeat protein
MSEFSGELAHLMAERGVGVRQLARALYVTAGHVSNLRNGKARPSPELARALDDYLGGGGRLTADALPSASPDLPDSDEIAAIELGRRALVSDVGDGTCEQIEAAADEMAVAYHRTPPAVLLPRVRRHLGYVTGLLDGRATLAQRRRLLVSGGWLSLLAATVLADLHDDAAAFAYLRTAAQLGGQAEHAEIAAWTYETRAWIAVTAGRYKEAAALAVAGQEAAPRGTSALIQSTAQEGRAWARLGDQARTRAALARVEALASPLRPPEMPEHHYHYDPAKAEAYVVTTLAWSGDPAAEDLARDVLARFESPAGGEPRHRRATAARLDLALALAKRGRLDEAAGTALDAVTSGYLVPSNFWRAGEIVEAVGARDVPEARELAEAYRAEVATANSAGRGLPPALP